MGDLLGGRLAWGMLGGWLGGGVRSTGGAISHCSLVHGLQGAMCQSALNRSYVHNVYALGVA